jgi:hypothetical protein
VISSARIPILKLRFEGKLEVDLSFQNVNPFPNSQLLRAYAQLDPAVRQLVILVKLWAKAEGVCGAPDGHLSSYSFTLMAIYFMQVDPSIKMPVLPTAEFTGEKYSSPVSDIQWSCPLYLPMLMARFFEFYATQYHWGYETISVRSGERIYVSDPTYSQLQADAGSVMPHIEDPFLLTRNLNCVLGWEQNIMLRNKLNSAIKAVQMGSAPFGFITAMQWSHTMSMQMAQTDAPVDSQLARQGDHNKPTPVDSSLGGDNPQSGTAVRGKHAESPKDARTMSIAKALGQHFEAGSTGSPKASGKLELTNDAQPPRAALKAQPRAKVALETNQQRSWPEQADQPTAPEKLPFKVPPPSQPTAPEKLPFRVNSLDTSLRKGSPQALQPQPKASNSPVASKASEHQKSDRQPEPVRSKAEASSSMRAGKAPEQEYYSAKASQRQVQSRGLVADAVSDAPASMRRVADQRPHGTAKPIQDAPGAEDVPMTSLCGAMTWSL